MSLYFIMFCHDIRIQSSEKQNDFLDSVENSLLFSFENVIPGTGSYIEIYDSFLNNISSIIIMPVLIYKQKYSANPSLNYLMSPVEDWICDSKTISKKLAHIFRCRMECRLQDSRSDTINTKNMSNSEYFSIYKTYFSHLNLTSYETEKISSDRLR